MAEPLRLGSLSAKMFPSPCGEKVGINRRPLLLSTGIRLTMFPSPCGEKVGINLVSWIFGESFHTTVSVPLRGKGRDQPHPNGLTQAVVIPKFPSPCGEKVGINSFELEGKTITKQMFPSPCGEKVGINLHLFKPHPA